MKTLKDLMEGLSIELDKVKDCANAPRETQVKVLDEGTAYASLAKQYMNAHDATVREYGLLAKGVVDKEFIEKFVG